MKKEWIFAGWVITLFLVLFYVASIYTYQIKILHNERRTLEPYRGKVMLIVNTASQSNYTPQLSGLEKLYQSYRGRGFEVIGFPSNQFTVQEPLNGKSIENYCRQKYGVTFPIFGKMDINSNTAHPLYRYLKNTISGFRKSDLIAWSFTKYLIDRNGFVIRRYSPHVKPEEIAADIEKIL